MKETQQPFLSEMSRRRKLGLFCRFVSPPAKVLEVGSGDGWFSRRLREKGYKVTTMDLETPADVHGDINQWRELRLQAASFDAVIGLEIIEHVDCLDAFRQLCRPDGIIMLSSPHPQWDWVMQGLEAVGLNQKRTSPHSHLVDFKTFPLKTLLYQRPAYIHQVGIFSNRPS
jgi:2-polyprenyl-3-methyl-5-hydroxy-6-metoxy-1,4-benzoquinol methylase